jgi:hypothetical protein
MRTQLSKRYAVTVILSHARNVTNRVVSDYYVRKRDHPVTRLTDPNVICMHQRRPYVAGAHDVNNRDNTKAGPLAAPCMPRTKKTRMLSFPVPPSCCTAGAVRTSWQPPISSSTPAEHLPCSAYLVTAGPRNQNTPSCAYSGWLAIIQIASLPSRLGSVCS